MSMIIVEHRIHKILLSRGRTEGPVAMNAFELISTSQGLNLSNLFEKQMGIVKREMRFTSKCSANEIIAKIEQAAGPLGFDVKKNNCKVKKATFILVYFILSQYHSCTIQCFRYLRF
ncbi:PREDICTED: CBL-interacting serine/threonine-protein kinase 23-like [Lupinus angustifolius]|uniref:CBL-interacting serine/threonine-protein kinase 23-like n=1 Tax=Lupinus angustifolius TaxID=3871 RepID=UPI00092E61B7|nr:PREDICTED: CBL-interacting serine/threonine-protein kinase 23-like [Lupinus angustifolius]